MFKIIRLPILLIVALSALFSCKKSKDDSVTPIFVTIDKGAALFDYQSTVKDTLFAARTKSSAYFRVSANTQNTNLILSRLYVFKRNLDNPSNPGAYINVIGNGYTKDANNQYYYKMPTDTAHSSINDISVSLRGADVNAIEDEYFFVYTTDADFMDPLSTDGVVIGPVQFFVKYGKLTEHKGIKIYNHATTLEKGYSNFDMVNLVYKQQLDASADIDISEKTDETQLFLGKFKSRNNTSFVKAPVGFSYGNATDIDVSSYFEAGTSFVETPDSIRVGDVYLIKIRDNASTYAAMKIMYVEKENGKVGTGNNNEYFIFNLKK